jgi:hypothetical protein
LESAIDGIANELLYGAEFVKPNLDEGSQEEEVADTSFVGLSYSTLKQV